MTKSDSIIEIAKALNKFQAAIDSIKKDAENPYYQSNYSTLDNTWDTIRENLTKQGLSVLQLPSGKGMLTMLMHVSGEWIEDTAELTPKDALPQSQGSAITYMRRYALAAALGLTSGEDDDGNAANGPPAAKPRSYANYATPSATAKPMPKVAAATSINTPSAARAASLALIKKGVTGDIAKAMTIARMKVDGQWTEEEINEIARMTFPNKPI